MTQETPTLTPLRLSVSKYKCFDACKKKYEFTYILKLPRKDYEHFVFGKFCHKVLENYHSFYLEGATEPSHIVMQKSYRDALTEYQEKLTPEMKAECKAIATQYLQKLAADKQNGTTATVLSVEKNFALPLGDNKVLLNGMIDKVTLDADNVLHVADYKTTKDKKYLKNDWFQLLTYALVLAQEDTSITKIRGSYIMLRHGFEALTKEFTIDEILALKDQYLKYANEILSETEFPPNPGFGCKWCEFNDKCDAGQEYLGFKPKYGELKW